MALYTTYMPSQKTYQATVLVLAFVLGVTAYQSLFRTPQTLSKRATEVPVTLTTCLGDPIPVDYPYVGSIASPHTCAVQCTDGKPRYILYSNNKGTQCETPPGCNDYGEDHGITCNPPGMTTVQSAASIAP